MLTAEERLAELLVRWDEVRASEKPPDPETFCAVHGATDLAGEFRAMIACFDSLRLVEDTDPNDGPDGDPLPPAGDPLPPAGGRFQVSGVLGRGGLGVVYRARDAELERDVALKLLQRRAAADPMARERFEREALLTGRLDHPGVVPVHSLSRAATGDAYYAMRVIGGESMREAIERHHHSGRDPSELRRLLRGFAAACETVAYAHSKSIIHRDLKPHNVMLGEFGETLVIDWGLASECGVRSAEFGTEDGRQGISEQTVAGRAMGTWGYMSPEQARGEWDKVGPASDIFSLGATLYQVLTGRSPYMGSEVQADVLACRYPPATGVPKALAAVCYKAMSPVPADRYGDARELAREVERWLADEPVTAYRDPPLVRARRWAKRHRTLVASALALLVTAVIGLATGLFFVNRERNLTEQARVKTKEALDQVTAEQTRTRVAHERTRGVLDMVIDDGVEPILARQPRIEQRERQMLEKIMAYYDQHIDEVANPTMALRARAYSQARVGMVRMRLGQREAAEKSVREGIEHFQHLVEQNPDHANAYLAGVVEQMNVLVIILKDTNRKVEAEKMQTEAVALRRRIAAAEPENPGHLQSLANSINNLAVVHYEQQRHAQAIAGYREALDIYRKLVERVPRDANLMADLVRQLWNLADTLMTVNDLNGSEKLLQEATEATKQLLAFDPKDPVFRYRAAGVASSLGELHIRRMRMKQAEDVIAESRLVLRQLVREFPSVPEHRQQLSYAAANLAVLCGMTNRQEEARANFLEAVDVRRRLMEDYPDVVPNREQMARVMFKQAIMSRRWGDLGESARLLNQYLDVVRPLLEVMKPEQVGQQLRDVCWNLADVSLRLNDHATVARVSPLMVRAGKAKAADGVLAARFLARASAMALDNGKASWWQRLSSAESHALAAVRELRAAVAAGFKDVASLKTQTDFDAIRVRPDFMQLLNDISTPK